VPSGLTGVQSAELVADAVVAKAPTTSQRIGTLPHPGLRLRAPLLVEVERQGDQVGVWSPDLEEFGYGSHLTAAIEDFQRGIVELYLELESQGANLAPALAATWERLQQFVEPRQ
jgi:hypothetical protein